MEHLQAVTLCVCEHATVICVSEKGQFWLSLTLEVTVFAQNKQRHHQDCCFVSVVEYYSFNNAQGEWKSVITIDTIIKKQLNLVNLVHRRYNFRA